MGKKLFKDTKIGAFLKEKAPKVLDLVDDVFPPAKILTALIGGAPELDPEQKAEAMKLMQDYELELERIAAADRANARSREVEMAKTGRRDWLMYAAGITALSAFILMVVAVIFIPEMKDNPLFHQLMGIIEGVALTIFAYYFGSSKGSNDKTAMLAGKS